MHGNITQTVYAVTVKGRNRSIYWPELLGEHDAGVVAAKLSSCGFRASTWPVNLQLPDPSSLTDPAIEPWNVPANLEAVASPGPPLYDSEEEYRSGPIGQLWDAFAAERLKASRDAATTEPPKRGDDGRSETFETLDATFIVRSEIQVPVDCKPVPLPRTLIERQPDGFCIHGFNFRREGEPGDGPFVKWEGGSDHRGTPEEAWNSFVFCMDCQDVSIFVGPGTSPVVLEDVTADARYFQVWSADEAGNATFAGRSLHRLGAMAIAKRIVADGGCPVVMSHYLEPDAEWECDSVEELPAPTGARKARRAAR